MQILSREFFRRHPADVAPDLLGKVLVRVLGGERLVGRIVETEAYSSEDPASHSYGGKTARNEAMFGQVGCAYVYFIHGMHYCMNATARLDTDAGGVLIRALEPLEGMATMQRLRGRERLLDLASGPAKLAQAMGINKALYGVDLTREGPLYLAEPARHEPFAVAATPRIGISRAVDVPWRFIMADNPFVSHFKVSRTRKS